MSQPVIHPISDVQASTIGSGTRVSQFGVVLPSAQIGQHCTTCAHGLFTKAIAVGEPTTVFNEGHRKRSFTYVDDTMEGVIRRLDKVPGKYADWDDRAPDSGTSGVAPYRLYNMGNEQPVDLLRYIDMLKNSLGEKAVMEMLLEQAGDLPDTEADVSELIANVG